MKHVSPAAAAAVVLVANAFALIHAWRNRSVIEADLTLTERELPLAYRSNDEDSGVSLQLRWMDTAWQILSWGPREPWLNVKILRELGFDTSVQASDPKAFDFYQNQRTRRAFVALEYDGPEWRRHLDEADRWNRRTNVPPHEHQSEGHLLVIDAASDAARLRARHPDRTVVIIVPAVVRIVFQPYAAATQGQPSRPATIDGSVQEVPSTIHVPRPFSDGFRHPPGDRYQEQYRVRLRYGASLEPWIAGVEFLRPARP